MRKLLLASSMLAFAICSQSAQAQDTQEEEDEPAGVARVDEPDSASGGLNVITVTAQRREETLQDAAIPINAASGEELLTSGVTDATLLNRVAPSLYVVAAGGANAGYFVRGVGNFSNNGYTAPASRTRRFSAN